MYKAFNDGGHRSVIKDLLLAEKHVPSNRQMLTCLENRRDYFGLYGGRNRLPAPQEFYDMYQQLVVGISPAALEAARTVCQEIRANGEDPRGIGNRLPALARRAMFILATKGEFGLQRYHALFPAAGVRPLRVDPVGWRLLHYYCSLDSAVLVSSYRVEIAVKENEEMPAHNLVVQTARMYFEDYVGRRGIERFETQILRELHRKGASWLQEIFVRLAQDHPGFTYDAWEELVGNPGRLQDTREFMFQLRLALANHYWEYRRKNRNGGRKNG